MDPRALRVMGPVIGWSPPTEHELRSMRDAGHMTDAQFQKAVDHLQAFERGEHLMEPHGMPPEDLYGGPMGHQGMGPDGVPGGPMGHEGYRPGEQMGPPTENELRAMHNSGHLTEGQFQKALHHLKAFERGEPIGPPDFGPDAFHDGPMGYDGHGPGDIMGPPTEEALWDMRNSGRISEAQFQKAMEHLLAFKRGEWRGGPPDLGPGFDHGPGESWGSGPGMPHDGPPTGAELQAAFDAGHLSREEHKKALDGVRDWEAAANDPAAREALKRTFQDWEPRGVHERHPGGRVETPTRPMEPSSTPVRQRIQRSPKAKVTPIRTIRTR